LASALTITDLRLAILRQVAQVAAALLASLSSPASASLAQPCSVAGIGLAARRLLDMTRVDEQALKSSSNIARTGFQYTPVASIATCVTR